MFGLLGIPPLAWALRAKMHRMPIEIAMYYVVWLYDGYTVTSYMQSSRSLEHT